MKIVFDNNTYIELVKDQVTDKYYLSLGSKDIINPDSLIVSSVELTKEQLLELTKDINQI